MRKLKRALKNVHIDEISFVDRPAMEGAVARLMKHGRACLFYKTRQELHATTSGIEEGEHMPEAFEQAVAKLRQDDPRISRTGAMSKAARRFPELLAKYQTDVHLSNVPSLKKSDAVVAFEERVDEIQARKRCSRLDALRKAAREYPEALEDYRTALS